MGSSVVGFVDGAKPRQRTKVGCPNVAEFLIEWAGHEEESILRILVAGESWVSFTNHIKGFDQFAMATYESGAGPWIHILETCARVDYLPNHNVGEQFPNTIDELSAYQAIILSDVGANTLLLHPDTWNKGQRTPNRLKLIREYVQRGGGFAMVGGYLTFQGYEGKGAYAGTPVEEVLPVQLERWDDRLEAPEGLDVMIPERTAPLLRGIPEDWPYLLGLNRLKAKPQAQILATADAWPLLVTGTYGNGRSLAWASDIGPHWCPQTFVDWPGYRQLWINIAQWLMGAESA